MTIVPFPQQASVPYQKMYEILFNAITDALDTLPAYSRAGQILREAQKQTEELYVEAKPENAEEDAPEEN